MEENNEHIDLFEKYLNGNLSQMEIEFFDKRLSEEADFAQEFEAHKNAIDIIKAVKRRDLKKQFATIGAGISNTDLKGYEAKEVVINSKSPFDSKKWKITFWIMIATGIAMAVTMIYALNNMPDIEEKFGLKENKKKHIEQHCVGAKINDLENHKILLDKYSTISIISYGFEIQNKDYRRDTLNFIFIESDSICLQDSIENSESAKAVKPISLCYRDHHSYKFNYYVNSTLDSVIVYGIAKGKVKLYNLRNHLLFKFNEELYSLPQRDSIAEPIKLDIPEKLKETDTSCVQEEEDVQSKGENFPLEYTDLDTDIIENDIEINNSSLNKIESELESISGNMIETNKEGVYDLNSVDNYPAFIGGKNAMYQHISNHIKLPEGQSINGKVYSTFIVKKNGVLEDIKIVKGINAQYNAAVLKVIEEMPNWNAATLKGKKVDCKFVLPITFSKE